MGHFQFFNLFFSLTPVRWFPPTGKAGLNIIVIIRQDLGNDEFWIMNYEWKNQLNRQDAKALRFILPLRAQRTQSFFVFI
jgi:hypothetical protein